MLKNVIGKSGLPKPEVWIYRGIVVHFDTFTRYIHIFTVVVYHNHMPRRTIKPTQAERLLQFAEKQGGIARARELTRGGISRATLQRLVESGALRKVARGLYAIASYKPSERHQLAEVALRSPRGVLCLLTALRFHDLTTQSPRGVWMALPNKAHKPHSLHVKLNVVWLSGAALTHGIETHNIDGVAVRIYSAAKTIADCFKFRNKIGLDVAIEALRDYRQNKRSSLDELYRYARICRVAAVMRPYLEMTV